MNCANHPEVAAAAYCRECGKPMCEECRRPAMGSVYCAAHVPGAPLNPGPATFLPPPVAEPASPYSAPQAGDGGEARFAGPYPHPAIAFGLGFIPGVGAIYNGQYAKGLIHAVVFGLLVSIASTTRGSLEPLVGIGIAVWVFYMAFEAYHTARNRRTGAEVEEFPGLFDTCRTRGRAPGGPIVLIGLGVLLLLDTTGVISFDELDRYWPVGLIALGVYLLYGRLQGNREAGR